MVKHIIVRVTYYISNVIFAFSFLIFLSLLGPFLVDAIGNVFGISADPSDIKQHREYVNLLVELLGPRAPLTVLIAVIVSASISKATGDYAESKPLK
jgi:hypothetical protein